MITLQITGKCQGCKAIDLMTKEYYLNDEKYISVYCRNEKICAEIERRLREQAAGSGEVSCSD